MPVAALELDRSTDRRIVGAGTPEREWAASNEWRSMRATTVFDLVAANGRIVVVAPHPDDEVLGCGGSLAMLAAAGKSIVVVAVTDGEASHAGSLHWPLQRLAATRRAESEAGLKSLGIAGSSLLRIGLPDGKVARHEQPLERALAAMLQPTDTVFTTWRFDGHPDHEATGHAVAVACARFDCRLIEMPVWMWHWARPGDPRVPWSRLRRIDLDSDALRRKRNAVAAHRSQIDVDSDGRPPVLLPSMLQRWLRRSETFLISEPQAS